MAVRMTVINKAEVIQKLDEIKDVKAKKAFERTRNDLAKNVPRLAAEIASGYYAISRTKLNPNTTAGGTKGRVSAVGSTIMDLEFIYRGRRLHVGGRGSEASFGLAPGTHRKSPYKLQGKILRGGTSPYGHWDKPWSEGGKYGSQSPYQLLPKVQVPIRRNGEKWTELAMGPSVPQMVVSENTDKQLRSALETMMLARLEHNLSRVLGS